MSRSSSSSRLVVAVGSAVALVAILVGASLLLVRETIAQAGEPDRPELGLGLASPPSPPPPLQLSPPTATPEPGAVQVSSGWQAGDSGLEVVQFRPDIRLQRGERPPVVAREKSARTVDSDRLERPSGGVMGPQGAYQSPDVAGLLSPMGWNLLVYEDFEGIFPGDWILEDYSNDEFERTWGDTNFAWYAGSWSAWPAAYGADAIDPWVTNWYTDNLNSWMEQGPLDFSNMTDAFVSFGLYYDTEPEWDWVYFCASIDYVNYDCDYWSGYSDGWTDQAYWLTSYAGYSQVWLAWVFISDESISDYYWGPYVDEILVWADDLSAPPVTPTPDPAGDLIVNGSFETGGLPPWTVLSSTSADTLEDEVGQPPSPRPDADYALRSDDLRATGDVLGITEVGVTNTTAVEGLYSTYLWRSGTGDDFLYQTFDVPTDVTDIVLNYWFAVTTYETGVGRDFFCASLRPADLSAIWVDMGCMDSADTTGYWQEVLYTLEASEVTSVAGQTVALVFELYNTGEVGTGSAGWVDYVRVYGTGAGAAGYMDPNEPNDGPADATAITCGEVITGVIGDVLGGEDVDWFELGNVPTGTIDIDIAADTKIPPSALDSVVGLWDSGPNLVTWNDDDGISYDSYLVYTNSVENASFYVSVESYSGYGSSDSFYDLTVECAGAGSGPPPGGTQQTQPVTDTWTVMLYLNAEDPSFESILTQYRTSIEGFIGSKSSFLTLVILYDGPAADDTTRYVVQPGGAYTLGTNRWNLGELNMGHPDTLANFVTWAVDQFPAEHYYLAIDDHGDGVYGISFDATSNNDQLTPPELYTALKSATRNGTRKIDIFDYEACLMGLSENAYDLKEWVDYVVFFEQISWGIDTYPVYFGDLAATDTPVDVGRRIIDRYHAGANGAGYPHTISLIDLSRMGDVSDAVTSFANTIKATDTQAQKDAINDARDSSQAFAADDDATNPGRAEYIDLWDLADKASSLAPTQAAAVKSAVNAAVVYERHSSGGVGGYLWDHGGVHGLSLYYPTTKSSSAFNNYVAPSLYQMSRDGTWDEFLDWVVPSSDRRGMYTSRSTFKLAGGDTFVFSYLYLPIVLR